MNEDSRLIGGPLGSKNAGRCFLKKRFFCSFLEGIGQKMKYFITYVSLGVIYDSET